MKKFKSISDSKKLTGLSYLGKVNNSTKHEKAYKYDELVYTLYLAPAKISGYEVCPMRSEECTNLCVHESGRNRMDIHENTINKARIKKTKMFFEERDFFIDWMIEEIKIAKVKAEKMGYHFSVRLNNTSDLSPESFFTTVDNKKVNVLQMFPDVQFYDYTKVPKRFELTKKYTNYDLTFSFSGNNLQDCITMLNNNIRVAVVFSKVPNKFWGRKVIDGDLYDMRYRDDKGIIIGLKYKQVRNKLNEKYSFVIQNLE